MLALPSLKGIPSTLVSANTNMVAARMALELLPRRAAFSLKPGPGKLETRALRTLADQRMRPQLDALRVFDIELVLNTSTAVGTSELRDTKHPSDQCGVVLVCNRTRNYLDGVWVLEPRCKKLNARVPGLAEVALDALYRAQGHGLQLYTPDVAVYYCQYTHWYGEANENEALNNSIDDGRDVDKMTVAEREELIEETGIVWTRKALDEALPNFVQRPNPRSLSVERLKSVARGRGEPAEVARAVLALRAAMKGNRSRKGTPEFRSGWDDEVLCFGYGAAIRWNDDDPTLDFFDDYGQQHGQDNAVDPIHGMYVYEPGNLDGILRDIETRLRFCALTEDLLHMIARRA